MLEIIEKYEKRLEELNKALADPAVISDQGKLKSISRERRQVEEILELGKAYKNCVKNIMDAKEILRESDDPDMIGMAEEELKSSTEKQREIEGKLNLLLSPRDPNDDKNVIIEIRAGTGGEEAGIFAADLYRMYTKYAEEKGWKAETLSSNPTELGGLKEVIFLVKGDGAYGYLKYESGVHRVQRVPQTESQGRIHTSAATVAVLLEAEEIDVKLNEEELKIDVYRSSGPGGQSVNTTDSAVRITHLPTGMVVTCQDEKSQHKNKARALQVLRARLLDRVMEEQNNEIAKVRRRMVSTGDRSAKIRTYNFPQSRVTDHRIGLTLYKLDEIISGNLDGLITALQKHDQDKRLESSGRTIDNVNQETS
jgi:peptide chain release factor 1